MWFLMKTCVFNQKTRGGHEGEWEGTVRDVGENSEGQKKKKSWSIEV